MPTPVEKRNSNKFCEFYGEVRHNTDECMHLKRKIKELIKNGKLSHVIKELKQGSKKGLDKDNKKGGNIRKGQASGNLDGSAVAKSRQAESYTKLLPRLRPEVKSQMIPATASLIGFSGEIIWPIEQILLPVKIGDAKHFTSMMMNFVVVRSSSPYNGIIRRPGVRKIQAVPSTAHEMLKFLVLREIHTLWSSRIIPLECKMVSEPKVRPSGII
nr:reverse transcriptase domain-containing protein [Tanacetum cinerariifolium]